MRLPEYVADGAWETVRRLFALVFRLLIDTGGRSIGIRFGSGSVVWGGASRLTATTTVPHGLGKAPVAVVFGSGSTNLGLSSTAIGATTFGAIGNTLDGTSPVATTARTFYWLAIG